MTKLVQVDFFRHKYGIQDIDAVNELIALALDSVSLHLESLLPTRFAQHTATDMYWIHPEELPFNGEFVKLILNSGFVHTDTLVAHRSPRLSQIINSSDLMDSSNYHTYDDKGLVYLHNSEEYEKGMAVSITYTAGFPVVSDGEYGYCYTDVPEWLQEIAIMMTMDAVKDRLYANDTPTTNTQLVNPLQLLVPHQRQDSSAYLSVSTSWK